MSNQQDDGALFNFHQMQEVMSDESSELIELLQSFFEDVGDRLTKLKGLLQINDLKAISKESHQIKGMSASFGLSALARAASALETTAQAGNSGAMSGLVISLEAAYRETVRELKRMKPHYFAPPAR